RAARHSTKRRLSLDPEGRWKGFFLEWAGRWFLVGKGVPERRAIVKFATTREGFIRGEVGADPGNGTFALDFGRLTRAVQRAMQRGLDPSPAPSRIDLSRAERRARVSVSLRQDVRAG